MLLLSLAVFVPRVKRWGILALTNQLRASLNISAIPVALRERPQWVLWRYVGPERRKVPINAATGHPASSTDPSTWRSFAVAHAALQRGGAAGLGYVFSAADPFTGVDLDDCITDVVIAPWAQAILDQLASYAEISPSGTGVKIWVCGRSERAIRRAGHDVPASLKPADLPGGVEIYADRRFFTVTGQHLHGSPAEPAAAQPTLDRLVAALCPPTMPVPATTAPRQGKAELTAPVPVDVASWVLHVKHNVYQMVAGARDGEKHNQRYAAGRLGGGLIAHGLASESEIIDLILQANPPRPAALQQERKAICAGIASGIHKPLTIPAFFSQARAPNSPSRTRSTMPYLDRTTTEPVSNSA